jgi:uncharacterized membrane protein YbhN (UPF0104 family)
VPGFAAVSFAPPLLFRITHGRLAFDRPAQLLPAWLRSRAGAAREAGSSLRLLLANGRLTATFPLFSWTIFALMVAQFWLLTQGLGESITPAEACAVLVFANLAGMLSALPLGLGATDVVMVSLLRAYGVDAAAAAAITVLARCLIHLPTGLLGLAAYLVTLRQRPGEETPGLHDIRPGLTPNPE